MSKPLGDNADYIAAEIEAEFADHLATAAEQFAAQGLTSDEARQKSQERFGDAGGIAGRFYWIKQGTPSCSGLL